MIGTTSATVGFRSPSGGLERLPEQRGQAGVALGAGMEAVACDVLRMGGQLLPGRVEVDQDRAMPSRGGGDQIVPQVDLGADQRGVELAVERQLGDIRNVADQDSRSG